MSIRCPLTSWRGQTQPRCCEYQKDDKSQMSCDPERKVVQLCSHTSPVTGTAKSEYFPSSSVSCLPLRFNVCIYKQLKFDLSHFHRVKWGNDRSVPSSVVHHPQFIGTYVNTRNNNALLMSQGCPV